MLESSDVHVAQRLTALAKESDETVALAVALVVRALRGGSVCVDLRSVEQQVGVDDLPWPDVDAWLAAVRASPLAGTPPVLRLDGDLLYLDRYWREEQQVCDDVLTMIAAKPAPVSPDIDRLFPAGFEEQRAAAEIALAQGLTVLTGGPGTGKTTTVARLLALLAEQAQRLRIALAAPTGKAAARLQEAVQLEVDKLDAADREALSGLHATTLHRLLGSRPDTSARFRHNRGKPVAARRDRGRRDVDGVADDDGAAAGGGAARCAADPGRRSGPAGVGGGRRGAGGSGRRPRRARSRVAALKTLAPVRRVDRRLGVGDPGGRRGRGCEVLRAGGEHIEWIDIDDPAEHLRKVLLPHALELREAAILGDAEAALATLDEHRLLCAHRRGPYGVRHWNRQVERWLAEATGEPIWSDGMRGGRCW